MAISTRQVKNKRDSNGVLTGRPGTVYDVNIKYTAPDGKKKSYAKKGFATKKEAAQHEAEMKTKLQNPGQVASITSQRKQTVAAYLNDWVESYARVNLRPSTYDGYKKTIANYINPYIGGVALNQLTPAMVDKMFQQIIDKGLKPSTAAGAKRVLSVALSHARKYRYIETNAAKDTLTKFGKGDKTPDPYTPEQVKALMQRVEGTVWEMPVILGGLYGMRRSEILGLRWRNVDLENNTFDVTEQLPFKVPPKTKVIEEMAPPKSNGRKLPITELARPFFLKQLADCFPVANICLHKAEIRVVHNGRKGGQIARVRQLVKTDNPIVRVLLEHMKNEVASNKTRAASNNNRHCASPLSTNVPDISHP